MRPIPVILLTGALGAGKTTTLNRLLGMEPFRGRKIALVINEFGTLGIDGGLVTPGAYVKFELNKGSLFCICIMTDFIAVLEKIAFEIVPDVVLIEATGVAETRDLCSFMNAPHLAGAFEERANLCVVDARTFVRVAAFMRSTRSQVEWADGVLINKCDLAEPGEVERIGKIVASMNPHARITNVSFGEIPEGFIESLSHVTREGGAVGDAPAKIVSQSFEVAGPVDERIFGKVVEELGERLLRLKGYVDFGDGPVFVEVAGEAFTIKSHLRREGGTAFTAIGWEVTAEELTRNFERAFRGGKV